ncbi:ABC transporter substrate-binding protein [Persephonella sp.]
MKKAIFLVVLILTFIQGCEEKNTEYLKIGSNLRPGYEPLYLARELGFYNNKYIHFVEYSSASQVIRAYRNGIINGAALTLDEVLLLKSYGFNPTVVLVLDVSNGVDAIIAKPYIRDLKDLKGKKVGVENSALGAYILSRALQKAGLTHRDIEIVSLEIDEHYKAFVNDKVDAVVTFEPVKSYILKEGGRIIFDSSQIPDEIVDVLVVEERFIKEYPEIVKAIVKGWFKALSFWEKNPDKAYGIMAKREGLTPKQLREAYYRIRIPDVEENLTLINRNHPQLKDVAYRLLTIMRTNEIINQTYINLDTLFHGKFLEDR